MDVDETWIKSVLVDEDTSNPNGISKVIKIQTESGVGKHENTASDIIRLIITAQLHSGECVSKSFICKNERQGVTLEFMKEMNIFGIESLMYGKYLKLMKILSDNHGGTEESLWPICYGYRSDAILLEDIKACGYVTIQKRSGGMDWNHSCLVVKKIARFHALSVSLMQNGTVNPAELGPSVFHKNTDFVNKFHQQGIFSLADSIKAHWGPEWEDTADRLRGVAEDIGLKLQRLGESTKGTYFDVLNHGDCWTNNMMFKYDEHSSPLGMMFIDFQVCHVNCFSWDLTYFLYHCLLPDLRREIIGQLLDLYTLELHKNCKELEFKGEVPSRELVQKAMDEIMLFGLVNSVSTVPLLISVDKPDFEFDFDKLAAKDGDDCNPYQSSIYSDETCIDIMKRELEYYTNLKLF